MQVCQYLGDTLKILYISGEESKRQLKLRAIRLGVTSPNLYVMTETDVEVICEQIKNLKPDLVMIDSIQTMNLSELNSSPGSITQVRESANMLMRTAKGLDIPMFIVGHVNKEGSIAGPKVLEHIVDTVLHFEGDKQMSCRILRAVKNRYGSTNEIGVFEMTDKGLNEVANPSVMLLSGRPKNVSGTCVTCTIEGSRPILAVNALRMSHYPHNPYLYYLCDKYGLYVMDEANQEASGMYGSSLITSEFETSVIDRSDSMVYRDRNHASVIIWSYGNESGLGADGNGILYRMGDYLHKLDPTRPVQYEPFNAVIGTSGTTLRNFDIPEDKGGVDIKSGMYVHIDTMQKWLKNELANVSPYTPYIKGMPYILCEYDHAMGNSLGSLGDYWDFFRSNDQLQGGFIWDFVDQGVWTTDPKTGDRYIGYGGDFGDKPNDGNFCANGIISADGTLQPEIEEVERVQQNLLFEADDLAAGKISVENENIAVSASEYTFAWNITENGSVVQSGTLDTQSILPGKTAVVTIPYTYPENKDGCEYFLNIDAYRSLGKFSETSIDETITEHTGY